MRLSPADNDVAVRWAWLHVCNSTFLMLESLTLHDRSEAAKPATRLSSNYPSSVDQRLSRVEKALETLSETINTSLTRSVEEREGPETRSIKSDREATGSSRPQSGGLAVAELTLDDSHSFAYLGEASRHLELIKNKSPQQPLTEHQAASTALQDLSKSLTTVSLQPPFTDESPSVSPNSYYIPSRPVGYKLISCMSIHSPVLTLG